MSSADPIPTSNRLFAVIDDPSATDAAVAALVAAGVERDAITVLAGTEDEGRLEQKRTPWNRAMRFISFIAADQAVDMDWYRAALEIGRAVVVIATSGTDQRRAAIEALRSSGAHFVNHYGRMATEDVIRWRGEPPPVHWIHHR